VNQINRTTFRCDKCIEVDAAAVVDDGAVDNPAADTAAAIEERKCRTCFTKLNDGIDDDDDDDDDEDDDDDVDDDDDDDDDVDDVCASCIDKTIKCVRYVVFTYLINFELINLVLLLY
jgi:hypothetical protein